MTVLDKFRLEYLIYTQKHIAKSHLDYWNLKDGWKHTELTFLDIFATTTANQDKSNKSLNSGLFSRWFKKQDHCLINL